MEISEKTSLAEKDNNLTLSEEKVEDPVKVKDYCPKAFVVDYSKILNLAIIDFVANHNDDFKVIEGKFIYVGKFVEKDIRNYFTEFIFNKVFEINEFIGKEYPKFVSRRIYIVDDANPLENLLGYKADIFENGFANKYYFTEDDIIVNLPKFENVWNKIFSKLFKAKKLQTDVFFLKNAKLSFEHIYKVFERVYGKSNTINCNSFSVLNSGDVLIVNANELMELDSDRILKNAKEIELVVEELDQYITRCANMTLEEE